MGTSGKARSDPQRSYDARPPPRSSISPRDLEMKAEATCASDSGGCSCSGSCGSSCSSCDSDSISIASSMCSDPYGEPSPPRNGYGGSGLSLEEMAALYAKHRATVVVHEEKAQVTPDCNRKRAAVARQPPRFSSSMCTTEGTSSLQSSSTSVKDGHAVGQQASAAHAACEEESKLPVKFTFTFKTIPTQAPQKLARSADESTARLSASTVGGRSPRPPPRDPVSAESFSASDKATDTYFSMSSPAGFTFSSPHSRLSEPGTGQDSAASSTTVSAPREPELAATRPPAASQTASTEHPIRPSASSKQPAASPASKTVRFAAPDSPPQALASPPATGDGDDPQSEFTDWAALHGSEPQSFEQAMNTIRTIFSLPAPQLPVSERPKRAAPMTVDELSGPAVQNRAVPTTSNTERLSQSSAACFGHASTTARNNPSPPTIAQRTVRYAGTPAFASSVGAPCRQPASVSTDTTDPFAKFIEMLNNLDSSRPPTETVDGQFEADAPGANTSPEEANPKTQVETPLDISCLSMTISNATRIANGRRGAIYRAYCGPKEVAVKVMTKPMSKSVMARVSNEVKVLQSLPDHPNLVKCHGFSSLADGTHRGLITDLIFGGDTIQTRLYRLGSYTSEVDKFKIALQVLDALASLHDHDVAHRDLSWRHVLHTFNSPPSVKLIDYGLPSLRNSLARTDESGLSSGATLEYASPEVLRGDLSCRDLEGWKKSDVFSFAILLVELLFEQPPWECEPPSYIVNAVAKRGERPYDVGNIRLLGRKYPQLEMFIRDAWHDNPSRRPSAAIMKAQLELVFKSAMADSTNYISEARPRASNIGATAITSLGLSAVSPKIPFTFGTTPDQPARLAPETHKPEDKNERSSSTLASTPSGNLHREPWFPNFSIWTGLSSLQLEISDSARITSGRRGSIYRAKNGTTQFAVKIVQKPISRTSDLRFEKELNKLRKLPVHPNLVRHYGCMPLADGNQHGIVTDLVIGCQTWEARLYSSFRGILLDEKKTLMLQLADTLAFLHSHDVTHRDLSLKHVLHSYGLTSSSDSIKLVDFGIPCLRKDVTPAYASPEALRGGLSSYNEDRWKKSDIFSFAVLMVEVFVEARPWEGESSSYIKRAVSTRGERPFQLKKFQKLFGDRSPSVEALVRAAWNADPFKRPTADELKKLLDLIFRESASVGA